MAGLVEEEFAEGNGGMGMDELFLSLSSPPTACVGQIGRAHV